MSERRKLGGACPEQAAEAGYQRPSELIVRAVGDEVVILDRKLDQVHQLNVTASLIWRLLDQGLGPRQIAGIMAGRFDISEEIAYQDIEEALSDFVQLRLLTEASRTRSSTPE